jgi:hypothetical protein
LADALRLEGSARELFVAAASGRGPASGVLVARHGKPGAFVAAATRALPRDIAAFTGRQAELARLAGALDGLRIKDDWHRRPAYPHHVGGLEIYTAVIDDGVRTPDQFGI